MQLPRVQRRTPLPLPLSPGGHRRRAPSPPPTPHKATLDGALERKVQELLKFKMCYGRPHAVVRWAGCDASGDMWEHWQLDILTK